MRCEAVNKVSLIPWLLPKGVVVDDPLEVPLTGGGFVAFVAYVAPASNFAWAARCSGVTTTTNAASGSVTSDCAPRTVSECSEDP